MRCSSLVVVGVSILGSAVASSATELPETGWYVVRPGDTLEDITRRHGRLGVDWHKNHQLNPDVGNPNLIYPGARLLLDLADGLAAGAVVVGLDREVALQPTPLDWMPARHTDILTGRSGLRTGQRATAALVFADGSSLGVAPDSVIFVAGRERLVRPGQMVEVVVGQTDVRSLPASRRTDDIEVVLGTARAVARPAEAGLAARTRRESSGQAQVMLYRGQGEVEAAKAKVELAPGTGTTVPPDAPPTPPEPLLPAPKFEPPAALVADGKVVWEPVSGAASYAVEVCSDSECQRVVERFVSAEPGWTPGFPPGTKVLARVAALTPSGLDGFPSEARSIEVVSSVDPPAPPQIQAAGPLVWLGEVLVVGPGGSFELLPTAEGVSVEGRIDGEAGEWTKGWPNGPHQLELTARDAAGQEATSTQLFVSDLVAPVISWQVGGDNLLEKHGLGDPRANRRGVKVDDPDRRVGLQWSTDGNNWWPLLVEDDRADANGVMRTWTVSAETPQLFLRRKGRGRGLGDAPIRLEGKNLARIGARDGESAVRTLSLQVIGGDDPRLRIEAVDLVGNSSVVEWPIDRDRL